MIPINNPPFWREQPLTEPETRLLEELFSAHDKSCDRNNASSQAVVNTLSASLDYGKAIAGAILTTGGYHAPIHGTIVFLTQPAPEVLVQQFIDRGMPVPGWGNSFERGHYDALWLKVEDAIIECSPELGQTLDAVTKALHKHGKMIYPNPSAYTAACAIILGFPTALAPYLFIAARLPGWTRLLLQQIQQPK